MEIKTFKDLKDFANSLDDKQLQQLAIVWDEGYIGKIASMTILTENYINVGYGAEPVSSYPDLKSNDYSIIVNKGEIRIGIERQND